MISDSDFNFLRFFDLYRFYYYNLIVNTFYVYKFINLDS